MNLSAQNGVIWATQNILSTDIFHLFLLSCLFCKNSPPHLCLKESGQVQCEVL